MVDDDGFPLSDDRCRGHVPGRGPSSFPMQNPEDVFADLALAGGEVFLDLGCGAGDYSLYAARLVGPTGMVLAVDREVELIDRLQKIVKTRGLGMVRPLVSDICRKVDVEDASVDACLVATVLHAVPPALRANVYGEIRRVLKPGGRLSVLECRKDESPYGPPPSRRLSPKDLATVLAPYGFVETSCRDCGRNYLMGFAIMNGSSGTGSD